MKYQPWDRPKKGHWNSWPLGDLSGIVLSTWQPWLGMVTIEVGDGGIVPPSHIIAIAWPHYNHIIAGWWLSHPSEKNYIEIRKSVGMIRKPIHGKQFHWCSKPPTIYPYYSHMIPIHHAISCHIITLFFAVLQPYQYQEHWGEPYQLWPLHHHFCGKIPSGSLHHPVTSRGVVTVTTSLPREPSNTGAPVSWKRGSESDTPGFYGLLRLGNGEFKIVELIFQGASHQKNMNRNLKSPPETDMEFWLLYMIYSPSPATMMAQSGLINLKTTKSDDFTWCSSPKMMA